MSLLEAIFERKRVELEAAKQSLSETELVAQAKATAKPRGFRHALAQDPRRLALIAEVKKASPSEGVIREDFIPRDIAHAYDVAGATCLSVLTDSAYFQGSADVLREVRATAERPLLRKDFICDPYQVWEARAWGADAVLAIVAYWCTGERPWPLKSILEAARAAELDVLVEVHNERELEMALAHDVDLVGVNNRDLSTFVTDLSTSERLIPQVPEGVLAVSESALSKPEHLERVRRAGARAVLIGTSFCRQPDVAGAVRDLFREEWEGSAWVEA